MNNLDKKHDGWETFLDRVDLTLGSAVESAEAMGVELVVENIEDRDPSARVRLVEVFSSPALKVSIDTLHAAYANGVGKIPLSTAKSALLLAQVHCFFVSNARSTTIIGAITGGRIGLMLTQAIQTQKDWGRSGLLHFFSVVVMVMAMDWFSGWPSRKLIGRKD